MIKAHIKVLSISLLAGLYLSSNAVAANAKDNVGVIFELGGGTTFAKYKNSKELDAFKASIDAKQKMNFGFSALYNLKALDNVYGLNNIFSRISVGGKLMVTTVSGNSKLQGGTPEVTYKDSSGSKETYEEPSKNTSFSRITREPLGDKYKFSPVTTGMLLVKGDLFSYKGFTTTVNAGLGASIRRTTKKTGGLSTKVEEHKATDSSGAYTGSTTAIAGKQSNGVSNVTASYLLGVSESYAFDQNWSVALDINYTNLGSANAIIGIDDKGNKSYTKFRPKLSNNFGIGLSVRYTL